jgi:hypothetical protein
VQTLPASENHLAAPTKLGSTILAFEVRATLVSFYPRSASGVWAHLGRLRDLVQGPGYIFTLVPNACLESFTCRLPAVISPGYLDFLKVFASCVHIVSTEEAECLFTEYTFPFWITL